ncbi:MAG: endonuclease/exonuclease/phosphatase family protein [Deltaproteobacteria bacterium]|nr:endonuclease/exonuclease/phosphatase family protein [Deltaproteobacteria bacterium]
MKRSISVPSLEWLAAVGTLLVVTLAASVAPAASPATNSHPSGAVGSVRELRVAQGDGPTPIGRVQGRGHISPFRGRRVTTTGIVTAVDTDGFYLQDPAGDGDPDTSDGIFVFTRRAPAAAMGDRLRVRGVVAEFQPGGAATRNLTVTQITRPRLTRLSRGNRLPAPVVLGSGGRVPPGKVIDNDGFAVFDPGEDGIDFYEALEGMRVTVRDAVAVSPTSRFGEIFVRARGTAPSGLSARGTLTLRPDDFNPERIQIDDDFGLSPVATPHVQVGDSLGDVTGVVSYGFGNYEVRFTERFKPTRGRLRPETTSLRAGDEHLTIATFNVLNLDPNDADGDTDVASGRFDAVASVIARNLRHPDIVALQEIQDNDGSAKTGVKAAGATLRLLVDRLAALGPVRYRFIDHPFIGDDTSGGQPGGNIRVAFLYNPARVELVPGSVATVTGPADQRTNPRNPFFNGRLPLVASFRPRAQGGAPVTVVNNHFNSKRGSSPLFGEVQPFTKRQEEPAVNGGVGNRRRQAEAVRAFVARRLAAQRDAAIVVLGDFNEFAFVSPLRVLERNLRNLTQTLPPVERYTYIFEGNAQSLDHILVSPSLSVSAEVDIVHVNAEFAETAARASDHDPIVVRVKLLRRLP